MNKTYYEQLRKIAVRVDYLLVSKPELLEVFRARIKPLDSRFHTYSIALSDAISRPWEEQTPPPRNDPLDCYRHLVFDYHNLVAHARMLRSARKDVAVERAYVFLSVIHDMILPDAVAIIGDTWLSREKQYGGSLSRTLKEKIWTLCEEKSGDKIAYLNFIIDLHVVYWNAPQKLYHS